MQIGGPAEGYMDAPSLNMGGGKGSGGSGGGSFIANILNLLGIEHTVAQGGESGAAKSKGKGGGAGTPAAATAAIPQDKTAMQNGAMYESHGAAAADGFLTGLGHGLAKGQAIAAPIAPPGLPATPSLTQGNPFLRDLTPLTIIDPNTVFGRP